MTKLRWLLPPLAVLANGCGPARAGSGAEAGELRGSAPDFTLQTLDGRTLSLSEYRGSHVVLVDFWATFCDPCLAAMPALEGLYRKHQQSGFIVLGVSIDGPDSVAQVRSQVRRLGVSFPILLDQETRAVALYNPKTSAPYSVLIGRDGRILAKKEGYVTGDAGALERDVERAVAAR
jgi:peroxiredoxin